MKIFLSTLIFLILTGSGIAGASEFCENFEKSKYFISSRDLLEHPGRYEGRTIEVIGLYYFGFPESYLLSSVDDFAEMKIGRNIERPKLRLDMSKPQPNADGRVPAFITLPNADVEGRIIQVKGTFHNRLVHGSIVALFIDDIQEFHVCSADQ